MKMHIVFRLGCTFAQWKSTSRLVEAGGVYGNELKTAHAADLEYLCPAPLDDDMIDELNWLAAAVFRVTGALDVSRIDFRLDVHDNFKPYILEINPPCLV